MFLQTRLLAGWPSAASTQPWKTPRVAHGPRRSRCRVQGGTTTALPLSNFSLGEEEPLLPLLLYRNQAGEKTQLKANPEAQCEKSTLFAVLSVVKACVCDYLGTFFFVLS